MVLVSENEIESTIHLLASLIKPWVDADSQNPAVLVSLLEGGRFYTDRLIRELRTICSSDFSRTDIKASTRDGNGRPLEAAELKGDIEALRGRRLLIIDDILDSGTTLKLVQRVLTPIALELKSTVLIQKDDPTHTDPDRPNADYVGLKFTDSRWYSGAGMDMPNDPDGKVRNSSVVIAYPPVFN